MHSSFHPSACSFRMLASFVAIASAFANVGAQESTPLTQIPVGYTSYGFPGAGILAGSAAAACRQFLGYSQQGGGLEYRYHDAIVSGGSGGSTIYTCQYKLIDSSIEPPREIGPVSYGNVAIKYQNGCQGPLVEGPAGCRLPPVQDNGDSDNNTCNPINTANGNKFVKETIYRGEGPFPLDFKLFYNTRMGSKYVTNSKSFTISKLNPGEGYNANYPSVNLTAEQVQQANEMSTAIGWGWTHSYQFSLQVLSTTQIALSRPDGKVWIFRKVINEWRSDNDPTGIVVEVVDPSGTVTWEYRNQRDEREVFDSTGRLLRIINTDNLEHVLAYNSNGILNSVTDSFGRSITFIMDGGMVRGIIDPAGGRFDFVGGQIMLLNGIRYPDNSTKNFLYENSAYPANITGIQDENGVRFSTYEYDSQGRAFKENWAGGVNQYQISFSDDGKSSTITDPLGTTRKLNFQEYFGVNKRVSSDQPAGAGCVAASNSTSYDVLGKAISETDFQGKVTTFGYDAWGRQNRVTEAAGTPLARTTTTEWHPIFQIPLRIAEPKRLTTFTLSETGKVLTRTVKNTNDLNGGQGLNVVPVGAGRTWTQTYNAQGQVLTVTGPRTNVVDTTTFTYEAGNLKTVTNAVGHVTTFSDYDAHGRVGRIRAPNGVTTQLTYHTRGWLTSEAVSATGITHTTTYEYDPVGQLKKVIAPNGAVSHLEYDDAHRLTGMSDKKGNRIDYTLDAIGNRIAEKVKDPNGVLTRQITRAYDALNRMKQQTGGAQ